APGGRGGVSPVGGAWGGGGSGPGAGPGAGALGGRGGGEGPVSGPPCKPGTRSASQAGPAARRAGTGPAPTLAPAGIRRWRSAARGGGHRRASTGWWRHRLTTRDSRGQRRLTGSGPRPDRGGRAGRGRGGGERRGRGGGLGGPPGSPRARAASG